MSTGFTADFLGLLLAFVLGTTFSRFAQAWVAYRLGDRQVRSEGRLSLNPGRQHEPLGLLLALFLALGRITTAWGKPINMEPLVARKRFGLTLVGLTGPLAYILLAAVVRLIAAPFLDFNPSSTSGLSFPAALVLDFIMGNLLFAAFNLLPLPPLDGWYILKGLWRPQWDLKVTWVETYGVALVIVLTLILPLFRPELGFIHRYYFVPIAQNLAQLLQLSPNL